MIPVIRLAAAAISTAAADMSFMILITGCHLLSHEKSHSFSMQVFIASVIQTNAIQKVMAIHCEGVI